MQSLMGYFADISHSTDCAAGSKALICGAYGARWYCALCMPEHTQPELPELRWSFHHATLHRWGDPEEPCCLSEECWCLEGSLIIISASQASLGKQKPRPRGARAPFGSPKVSATTGQRGGGIVKNKARKGQ